VTVIITFSPDGLEIPLDVDVGSASQETTPISHGDP
jgi:hypothetical protein